MNEQPQDSLPASREEMLAALFANMVIQQTNMALMFLGRVPHPETGQHIQDLETAQMFIDQLDMLEAKTKGNLNKQEVDLLKQSLAAVRMAFVQAVEQKPESVEKPSEAAKTAQSASSEGPAPDSGSTGVTGQASTTAEDSESRRKFTKKY